MTRDEFKNLKLGEVVQITTYGKNRGKMGIVKEIRRDFKDWETAPSVYQSGSVYLKPLNCVFDFVNGLQKRKNKNGFYSWSHRGVNYPNKVSDKDIYGTWIPVSERLPEKPTYDWVLIQCKLTPEDYYGVPHIGELRNGVWYSDCYIEPLEEMAGIKVTHWCPLPNIQN